MLDWSGGTRIATSLHAFNKHWARRVLTQGAIVLLITDGLERDPDDRLAFEIDRLHRSCRRLIWLNPLLRFEGFEAKAKGIRAMLPHVDEFRPIHNLESMAELCRALSATAAARRRSEGVAEEGGVTSIELPHGRDHMRGDVDDGRQTHGTRSHATKTSSKPPRTGARPGAGSRSRPWSRPGARRRGRSARTS